MVSISFFRDNSTYCVNYFHLILYFVATFLENLTHRNEIFSSLLLHLFTMLLASNSSHTSIRQYYDIRSDTANIYKCNVLTFTPESITMLLIDSSTRLNVGKVRRGYYSSRGQTPRIDQMETSIIYLLEST